MRLDVFLYESKKTISRSRAKELIEKGAVSINGQKVLKPSFAIDENFCVDCITIDSDEDMYVSRGGYKLAAALRNFGVDVSEVVALDIGASTGGFTDCLLKNGAKKVYAVDSGKGQLSMQLLQDNRVVSIENYNARYMKREDFSDEIEVAVMDVSFISQTLIIPSLADVLSHSGVFISLIKPQFEVGKSNVGKNGIVKSDKARREAVENVCNFAKMHGLELQGVIESPIKGGDGNIEFLACFKRS